MDLHPTDEQLAISEATADYVRRELPAERVPKQAEASLGARDWQGLADMGWFGLAVPEALGGVGLSIVEEALVVREFGRELLPPQVLATMLAAHAAAELGDTDLARELIDGKRRAAFAVQTGDVASGPYRLVDTDQASLAVAWDGGALLLAELEAFEGRVEAQALDRSVKAMRAERVSQNALRLLERARSTLPLRASLLNAAMMTGDAEGMSERAVEYAKVRQQFGRPIGSFQAISHRLAKMAARCEAAVAMLQYTAVWLRDGFENPDLHVAAARVVAADAARENAAASMQVFGGYGQTYEYLPHLYLKRGLMLSMLGGGAAADEETILNARSIL